MSSVWIVKRPTRDGKARYRVMFQPGGREAPQKYAGTFATEREAKMRKAWVAGELAAMRMPDVAFNGEAPQVEMLRDVAERWRASRVDVSERTAINHRVDLARLYPALGHRPFDAITAADVASCIGSLGLKKETLRKTLTTLAQVFDFASVSPNPARDKMIVRLPRETRAEVAPPTAKHVESVYRLLPSAYRLPTLVLDATGMRVGELEALRWGDVDETAGKWRVSGAVAKTRRARWVPVTQAVFAAVVELVPREDRDLDVAVFPDFGADRFRTALQRACKASGTPVFSPHDLRHRRATLWHLSGVPAADAAAWLGHTPTEHLRTYAHAALVERGELNVSELLAHARTVLSPVLTRA
jgi:integrase